MTIVTKSELREGMRWTYTRKQESCSANCQFALLIL